jgi:predicted MFS family arabinose efflux permease
MQATMPHQTLQTPTTERPIFWLALALSLGAALSLGITRFAYGLLLSPMRSDLGWSYTLAGGMNTLNALGYLLGALMTPALLKRYGASHVLLGGSVLASGFMGLSGFFTDTSLLLVQRLLAGVASALVFIAGGLLAARLGTLQPARGGLLIGLYYGGTGLGIVVSACLVPWVLGLAGGQLHAWAWAWWSLALVCLLATVALVWPARVLMQLAAPVPAATLQAVEFTWRPFAFALAGYGMFGVGYIGYMTFVIALLREQGVGPSQITLFYALLGLAVLASSRIWARLLDRYKGGQVLALLCALLGLATVLPAWTSAWSMILVSGMLFGGVFLSLVASTTALVRHNLAPAAWAKGISAFTIVFAAGQIVGPTMVGWIADGPGGLARGLVFSALALWVGAALAWQQRAL